MSYVLGNWFDLFCLEERERVAVHNKIATKTMRALHLAQLRHSRLNVGHRASVDPGDADGGRRLRAGLHATGCNLTCAAPVRFRPRLVRPAWYSSAASRLRDDKLRLTPCTL